jgi:uncharacterized coiled-coil DUF342 family protein
MVIEQRISRLEGAYEQVDRRLDEMHQSINGLRAEMNGLRVEMHESINSLRTEMNSRLEEMNSRFNTLYVLIAASWVTIIGAMIGLYFK